MSLMADTTASKQLPAQMPQPPTWALSLLPGTRCQGRVKHSSCDTPPSQSCQPGTEGTYLPILTLAWGREEEEGLPPPQAVLALWSWGKGYSYGKLAEAAGSSRESGKNDIKPGKMQAGWRA